MKVGEVKWGGVSEVECSGVKSSQVRPSQAEPSRAKRSPCGPSVLRTMQLGDVRTSAGRVLDARVRSPREWVACRRADTGSMCIRKKKA